MQLFMQKLILLFEVMF